MKSYTQIIKRLQQRIFAHKSKAELKPIHEAYKALNLKPIPFIHVAGTNGKGSVCTKISAALTKGGYKVGCFTSPHLSSFRERITLKGNLISKEEAIELLDPLLDQFPNLTFFEINTLLALVYFSKHNADIAVIEVGLGGRMDATNCITPILSVITSIGLDHQHILGNTLEEIAFEKGGIIKNEVPVLVGPKAQQKILPQLAKERQSPFYALEGNYASYDDENKAIALKALELIRDRYFLNPEAIEIGLKQKQRCRMEEMRYKGRLLLLDMTHNLEGLKALKSSLEHSYKGKPIVTFFACSGAHDARGMLEGLAEISQKIYLLSGEHPRLQDPKKIQAEQKTPLTLYSCQEGLNRVEKGDPNILYLFTGTIFIMAELFKAMGEDLEEDPWPILDGSLNFSESKVKKVSAQSGSSICAGKL